LSILAILLLLCGGHGAKFLAGHLSQQQEDMAFQLQQLAPAERSEFTRLLDQVAGEWPDEQQRQYLRDLPAAIGIA
jgi:hypothetical protein